MRKICGCFLLLAFLVAGVAPSFAVRAVPEQAFQAGPTRSDDTRTRHIFLGKVEEGRICSETGECFSMALGVSVPKVPKRRGRIIAELVLRDGKVIEVRFR